VVTFDAFWEIYCDLRDRVEAEVPEDTIMDLSQSIPSEPIAEGSFALENLKDPELDMRNAVDVEGEGEDNADIFSCEFTVDNDRDQLY